MQKFNKKYFKIKRCGKKTISKKIIIYVYIKLRKFLWSLFSAGEGELASFNPDVSEAMRWGYFQIGKYFHGTFTGLSSFLFFIVFNWNIIWIKSFMISRSSGRLSITLLKQKKNFFLKKIFKICQKCVVMCILDILFRQITTIIKVCVGFVFVLQTLELRGFNKIYQLKGLKAKNKGHTNFYECCDLTKKHI